MKLDAIFSSNMVFAANKSILIYGTGRGEAQICFAGLTKTVISADENCLWNFLPCTTAARMN